ncbi:MAG: 5'-nucleotidase C-terminal domain-containing protein [Bacteroidales bacterium]|nr:5'-nucleotidase C-terminal domain-containing protein [Bacteroidales bacterium]
MKNLINRKKGIFSTTIISVLFCAIFLGCSKEYVPVSITCEQIVMDSTLDVNPDVEIVETLDFYKNQIDSVMNQQIGIAAVAMPSGKPQSLLANFTADILRFSGEEYLKKPVSLALMNNGGLRAPIAKGPVTVEDIFKVFPFENAMVLVKLNGVQVKELFKRIAAIGGEGLSGCQLVVKDNKVVSLKIDAKPVEDNNEYWLATIDYLADGNSGMSVLEKASERVDTGILLRDVMLNYIKAQTAQGKELTSSFDDRIDILK